MFCAALFMFFVLCVYVCFAFFCVLCCVVLCCSYAVLFVMLLVLCVVFFFFFIFAYELVLPLRLLCWRLGCVIAAASKDRHGLCCC